MESETVGDTRGVAQTFFKTLAERIAEKAAWREGDIRGYAQALVVTLVDSISDFEAETLW